MSSGAPGLSVKSAESGPLTTPIVRFSSCTFSGSASGETSNHRDAIWTKSSKSKG